MIEKKSFREKLNDTLKLARDIKARKKVEEAMEDFN